MNKVKYVLYGDETKTLPEPRRFTASNYNEWEEPDFAEFSVSNSAPLTILDIIIFTLKALFNAKVQTAIIKICLTALAIIAAIFWVYPAIHSYDNPSRMAGLGTWDVFAETWEERHAGESDVLEIEWTDRTVPPPSKMIIDGKEFKVVAK